MTRLLALTRYSRLGASSRLRTMQYIPALERMGFEVEVSSFFDDAYLQSLYGGSRSSTRMLGYFGSRLKRLARGPKPDIVWVEKETLPWMPWVIEAGLLPRNVPLVSDYDDAVFHRYDINPRKAVRLALGKKIDRVMGASALVTAGNEYLAERARSAGARRVEIVPTVVDADAYLATPLNVGDDRLRVGWIGTPQTWKELAAGLFDTVQPVLALHDARFRAVGASLEPSNDGALEILTWSEESEIDLIRTMDIGVMPLPDTPWTRGKCGYKLIQYMACGVPVIASPVGVNSTIVDHGVNGFLATSDEEWRDATETLLGDAALRKRMGDAGRRKVEEQYALAPWGARLADMLNTTIKEFHR